MIAFGIVSIAIAIATAASALEPQKVTSASTPAVVDATYDGRCFYPKPTKDFVLEDYLGRWYQAAGTTFGPTIGCDCIFADYSLNANGTVKVQNGCARSSRDSRVSIEGFGTVIPPGAGYGNGGLLRVQFPGQPPSSCPGPNYVVQTIGVNATGDERKCQGKDVAKDANAFAVVQAANFTTLFLLSRNPTPSNATIEAWLERARKLGSNLDSVAITDQKGCRYP